MLWLDLRHHKSLFIEIDNNLMMMRIDSCSVICKDNVFYKLWFCIWKTNSTMPPFFPSKFNTFILVNSLFNFSMQRSELSNAIINHSPTQIYSYNNICIYHNISQSHCLRERLFSWNCQPLTLDHRDVTNNKSSEHETS